MPSPFPSAVAFALALLLSWPAVGRAAPAECPAQAQAFWQAFRSAALSDPPQTLPLTAFPFKTRGSLDDSPWVTVPQRQFPALFAQLLRQDPGLAPAPSTMKAYAQAQARLLPDMCPTPDEFRVGNWVFRRQRGEWRFVSAYTEDE